MIALLFWRCFQSFKSFWVLHFHFLSLGDHQVLVQFHFCFCDLHNFHIVFLNVLHFLFFFKCYWMLCILSLSHGDHQGLILFHFFFCDLHNFHIILLNLLLFWNFFQMLLSPSYSLFITWWPLDISSISCFTFVMYKIFKCAFFYAILVITTNNDNMHWACWPLGSICNFKFLLTI
jgi:hypothetical protein